MTFEEQVAFLENKGIEGREFVALQYQNAHTKAYDRVEEIYSLAKNGIEHTVIFDIFEVDIGGFPQIGGEICHYLFDGERYIEVDEASIKGKVFEVPCEIY